MTDPDDLFAEELRRLQPRAASRELGARIGRSLDRPSFWRRLNTPFGGARRAAGLTTLAATAAIAVFAVVFQRPPDDLRPVSVMNVEYETGDEGIVTLADGTPARRVRFQLVDTITWRNPRTDASLEVSQTREELRDLPLGFN